MLSATFQKKKTKQNKNLPLINSIGFQKLWSSLLIPDYYNY